MNTAEQTSFLGGFRFLPAEREVFKKKESLTPSDVLNDRIILNRVPLLS